MIADDRSERIALRRLAHHHPGEYGRLLREVKTAVHPTLELSVAVEMAARLRQVDPADVLGTSRERPVALARHVLRVALLDAGWTSAELCAAFDAHHTTILHSEKVVARSPQMTAMVHQTVDAIHAAWDEQGEAVA